MTQVLSSRRNGDLEEYQPVLWYYDVLSFLDEILSPNIKFDDTVPQEKEVVCMTMCINLLAISFY